MSTWVERALQARTNGHKATLRVEPTLADRVRADLVGQKADDRAVTIEPSDPAEALRAYRARRWGRCPVK